MKGPNKHCEWEIQHSNVFSVWIVFQQRTTSKVKKKIDLSKPYTFETFETRTESSICQNRTALKLEQRDRFVKTVYAICSRTGGYSIWDLWRADESETPRDYPVNVENGMMLSVWVRWEVNLHPQNAAVRRPRDWEPVLTTYRHESERLIGECSFS